MNVITELGVPGKTGSCAVYLVVYIQGDRVRINTQIKCRAADWDTVRGKIRGNTALVRDHNMVIEKCRSLITDIIVRYRLLNREITPEILKQEYQNPSLRVDFYAFMSREITERYKAKEISYNTNKQHNTTLTKLKAYRKQLSFSEITPAWLTEFKRYLTGTLKNHPNTVHCTFKILKTYINIAIKKEIIQQSPFDHFAAKRTGSDRVFLDLPELQQLINLYNSHELPDRLQKVLRHFLFMCFTSLRHSDLVINARFDNLVSKTLVFVPVKTRAKNTAVRIPLNRHALKLIKDEGNPAGQMFDAISDQKMNQYLKEIAALANINKPITTHTGRHTFATLWLNRTRDVATLQRILGHSNISDTMKYVHITDDQISIEMQEFEGIITE